MFCSSLLIDKLLLVRVKFVLLEGNELFKSENIYLKEENISKKRNIGEKEKKNCATRMGFEPTRAEHIGLAVQRLNHSATSSDMSQGVKFIYLYIYP